MPHQVWPHKIFTHPVMPIRCLTKNCHRSKLRSALVGAFAQSAYPEKRRSNLGELGTSGEISCNLIVQLDQHSKAPHPKTFIRVAKKPKHTKTT